MYVTAVVQTEQSQATNHWTWASGQLVHQGVRYRTTGGVRASDYPGGQWLARDGGHGGNG